MAIFQITWESLEIVFWLVDYRSSTCLKEPFLIEDQPERLIPKPMSFSVIKDTANRG